MMKATGTLPSSYHASIPAPPHRLSTLNPVKIVASSILFWILEN